MTRMESPKKTVRLTGLVGIVVLITGTFTHNVDSKLISFEDTSLTASNFIHSESMFRIALVSGLLMETVFVFYVFNLFRLLGQVIKNNSLIMLILALISVPLFLLNQPNAFNAFQLAGINVDAMMFFLTVQKHRGLIVSIFFGFWLFRLELLVYKSQFFPKLLGILVMIGSLGYVIHFFQGFLLPNYESFLWTSPFLIVTLISELFMMMWLLIKGIDINKWQKNHLMSCY
ncbi:MAG: DUF4386 domain-containing protein [Cyclobacteriaceae bacterium]|nr:DUF4386 domain-containing protein [Cyclobacteriaceae bacterium]